MKEIEDILPKIITKYTKENKQYSITSILKYRDILDFYITKSNNQINIYYTYYPDSKDEKNYVNSKIIV